MENATLAHILAVILSLLCLLHASPAAMDTPATCDELKCLNDNNCHSSFVNGSETGARCVCSGQWTGPRCGAVIDLSPVDVSSNEVTLAVTAKSQDGALRDYKFDFMLMYWSTNDTETCLLSRKRMGNDINVRGLSRSREYVFCVVSGVVESCVSTDGIDARSKPNCVILTTNLHDEAPFDIGLIIVPAVVALLLLVCVVVLIVKRKSLPVQILCNYCCCCGCCPCRKKQNFEHLHKAKHVEQRNASSPPSTPSRFRGFGPGMSNSTTVTGLDDPNDDGMTTNLITPFYTKSRNNSVISGELDPSDSVSPSNDPLAFRFYPENYLIKRPPETLYEDVDEVEIRNADSKKQKKKPVEDNFQVINSYKSYPTPDQFSYPSSFTFVPSEINADPVTRKRPLSFDAHTNYEPKSFKPTYKKSLSLYGRRRPNISRRPNSFMSSPSDVHVRENSGPSFGVYPSDHVVSPYATSELDEEEEVDATEVRLRRARYRKDDEAISSFDGDPTNLVTPFAGADLSNRSTDPRSSKTFSLRRQNAKTENGPSRPGSTSSAFDDLPLPPYPSKRDSTGSDIRHSKGHEYEEQFSPGLSVLHSVLEGPAPPNEIEHMKKRLSVDAGEFRPSEFEEPRSPGLSLLHNVLDPTNTQTGEKPAVKEKPQTLPKPKVSFKRKPLTDIFPEIKTGNAEPGPIGAGIRERGMRHSTNIPPAGSGSDRKSQPPRSSSLRVKPAPPQRKSMPLETGSVVFAPPPPAAKSESVTLPSSKPASVAPVKAVTGAPAKTSSIAPAKPPRASLTTAAAVLSAAAPVTSSATRPSSVMAAPTSPTVSIQAPVASPTVKLPSAPAPPEMKSPTAPPPPVTLTAPATSPTVRLPTPPPPQATLPATSFAFPPTSPKVPSTTTPVSPSFATAVSPASPTVRLLSPPASATKPPAVSTASPTVPAAALPTSPTLLITKPTTLSTTTASLSPTSPSAKLSVAPPVSPKPASPISPVAPPTTTATPTVLSSAPLTVEKKEDNSFDLNTLLRTIQLPESRQKPEDAMKKRSSEPPVLRNRDRPNSTSMISPPQKPSRSLNLDPLIRDVSSPNKSQSRPSSGILTPKSPALIIPEANGAPSTNMDVPRSPKKVTFDTTPSVVSPEVMMKQKEEELLESEKLIDDLIASLDENLPEDDEDRVVKVEEGPLLKLA